jgi:hypothetical protein
VIAVVLAAAMFMRPPLREAPPLTQAQPAPGDIKPVTEAA